MTYTIKAQFSIESVMQKFQDYGRGNQFSYEALEKIMNYLEGVYFDGVIDFDVIGICCEFSELDEEEFFENYGYLVDIEELKIDEEDKDESLENIDISILVEYYDRHCAYAEMLENGNILIINY